MHVESSQVRDIIINRGLTEGELRVWRQKEGPLAEKITELAQELGITKSATHNFFRILGEKQVPPEKLPEALAEIAERHVRMLEQLAILRPEDKTAKALVTEARLAVSEGDYGVADRLLAEAIQYYSCFISYSSKDDAFARRLHADLQNSGVQCWFAPHDLPIGAKTWDAIDTAIRNTGKLLLILSKNSIASAWVEDEVSKAFAEERRRNQVVLFPVRIDETVMNTDEPWAVKLRDQRNIGNFRSWKERDAYQHELDRVLRDLKAGPG